MALTVGEAFDLLVKAADIEYKTSKYAEPDGDLWADHGERPEWDDSCGEGEGWETIVEWVDEDPISVDDYLVTQEASSYESGDDGMYVVFRFQDAQGNSQLFKKSGWYASHVGGEWEGDFKEVKARPTTVIVYR